MGNDTARLSLPETLLLLSLEDATGSYLFRASTALPYGLAAAVLMELALRERVHVEDKVLVVSGPDTGDALLDECLASLRAAAKPGSVRSWVWKLGLRKWIRRGYLDRLAQKQILRREVHRILGVVPVTRYPVSSAAVKQEVHWRLRQVAMGAVAPDPSDLYLAGLVLACRLAGRVFLFPKRKERVLAGHRLAGLSRGEAYSAAVREALGNIGVICLAVLYFVSIAVGAAIAYS